MTFRIGTTVHNHSETEAGERAVDQLTKGAPMSPEEEAWAFARLRDGDEKALEEIVLANQRFVVTMASRFFGSRLSLDELIQECNIGLITAARKFDTSKGIRFITYARWWMRQQMQSSSLQHGYPTALPKRNWTDAVSVLNAWNEFENRTGRIPTIKELMEEADCNEFLAMTARIMRSGEYSFDAPIEDDERNRYELSKYSTPPPQEVFLKELGDVTMIDKMMGFLTDKERDTISKVYGLHGKEAKGVKEIGREEGVSYQAISLRRVKAVNKMRWAFDIIKKQEESNAKIRRDKATGAARRDSRTQEEGAGTPGVLSKDDEGESREREGD